MVLADLDHIRGPLYENQKPEAIENADAGLSRRQARYIRGDTEQLEDYRTRRDRVLL